MGIIRPRLLWGLLLCTMVAASDLCAQGPRGVGGDITAPKVERVKKIKPEKPTPLYTSPKSASWWYGGGPGPAGFGAK